MELKYPVVLLILLVISIVLMVFFNKKKIHKFISGSKIANTCYIQNTSYFKNKLKKYKIFIKILNICCIIGILCSCLLISRMVVVNTSNASDYNRDIFLCMDISDSVDDLNKELVENLKETVDSLHGERFGISIFNTSSVILVPLTDDYEYVIDILDKINLSLTNEYSTNSNNHYLRSYITGGTLEGLMERGSSLIGDGLASCVFSFSNLEEERTRLIIFSTDNELEGVPIVSLSKAAEISNSKSIKVFGIGTTNMSTKNRIDYRNAVEKTGGKFYEQSSTTVKNIVDDIEKTSKSLLKNQIKTSKVDIPQIPFIILVLSTLVMFVINKKVSR